MNTSPILQKLPPFRGSFGPSARLVAGMAALLLAVPTFAQEEAREEPADTVSISALNRIFDSIDVGFVPIEQGPIKILIASPEHRVEIFRNRIELRPNERWEGGVQAYFEVELEGWADLIATLETAAATTPFKDKVTVDRQVVSAEAVVRLVPTQKGYDLTLLEAMTPTAGVEIQSSMTRQLVDACQLVASFLGGVSCDAVSESLATVQMPLPEAGSQYEINASYLTPEEKAVFDRYIDTRDPSAIANASGASNVE